MQLHLILIIYYLQKVEWTQNVYYIKVKLWLPYVMLTQIMCIVSRFFTFYWYDKSYLVEIIYSYRFILLFNRAYQTDFHSEYLEFDNSCENVNKK